MTYKLEITIWFPREPHYFAVSSHDLQVGNYYLYVFLVSSIISLLALMTYKWEITISMIY